MRDRSPRTTGTRRAATALAGLVALCLPPLVPAPSTAADRDSGLARMVGVWQLDSKVSEDPLRKLRAALRGAPPPRRADAEERSAAAGGELEQRLLPLTRGVGVLTLSYSAPELTVTYWDDRQRVLRVDGKKAALEEEGRQVVVEAGWKGSDRLVVETRSGPGERRLEIWELGERGDKLFVTFELYRKGHRWPFRFERLYNRVTSAPER